MSKNENQLAGSNAAAPSNAKNPAALAAAATLINGAITAETSRYNTDAQIATNDKMIADSWSRWHADNLYNTPMAQVQRLKAAGINPGLLAGQLMDAGSSSSPSETPNLVAPHADAPQLDPLAASQERLNNAQAESLEHQTEREDEKQPITLQTMQAEFENLKKKTDEIVQKINNLKMDEQIGAIDNLYRSLQYSLANTTFNAAVREINEKARAAGLQNTLTEQTIRRAVSILPFELSNFDLQNRRLSAEIATAWQDFNFMKKTFHDRAMAITLGNQLTTQERTLKELEQFIEMLDNPNAGRWWKYGIEPDGFTQTVSFMGDAVKRMPSILDVLGIRMGINMKIK